jgi:hypothetical protein
MGSRLGVSGIGFGLATFGERRHLPEPRQERNRGFTGRYLTIPPTEPGPLRIPDTQYLSSSTNMLLLALMQVVALEGGTVHSMIPGETPRIATVLVEDGRISAVGEDLVIPDEATVIDLEGKHLVPGLIDGMVHHDLEHDPLYLLSGITLARDMGNDMTRIFIAAAPGARNSMPGPDLWISGAVFDGAPPATTEAVVVKTPEEVDDKLPRLAERGIQFVAIHLGIPEIAWRHLIELAHQFGLQVWGPIPRGVTFEAMLEAGQDGLCYLEWFAGDEETVARRVEALAQSGTALTPLLRAYEYGSEDPGADPPFLNFLAPYYADWWRQDLTRRRPMLEDPQWLERSAEQQQRLRGVLKALWSAGVPLVPGSAAPNPWLMPGAGLHDELAAWVEAGIPPAEVLAMATAGAAKAMGLAEERGTIAAGRVADIVVVDDDPTANLALLRHPAGVLLRGTWFDEAFLDELRSALLEAQREARRKAALPLEIEKPELPEGSVVLEGRVENRALDQVVAAEEYWVVRCHDGDTAWCSRLVTPGGIGSPESVQTQTQRFRDGKLERYEMTVHNGNLDYRIEGMQIGGQFRVKRWIGEMYLDTNSTSGRPFLVDLGMALPGMIMAYYRPDGVLPIIYFEGFDPAIASWELQLGDNGIYAVKTPIGPMVLTLLEGGGLDKLARVEGNSTTRYESVRSTTFGGPGMIPLAKRGGKKRNEAGDG